MHDLKDHRFKVKKERSKKATKIEQDDDDDADDADLEKELEGMYNWRQKRSWIEYGVYKQSNLGFVIRVSLLSLRIK